MSARRSRVHPRHPADIGIISLTARISGAAGSSDPKVRRCARKHAKQRRTCHHQRGPPRENAVETARAIPASTELTQRTPLEAASTESHRVAAADFAAPSSDPPKIPDLDAR